MATVAMLLDEIKSAQDYLVARGPSEDIVKLTQSFGASLLQQVNTMSIITANDASIVLKALEASSYGSTEISRIRSALDAKVLASVSGSQTGSLVKDQLLKSWWNMLSRDEVTFIMDKKKSFHSKLVRMVERKNLLGCQWPSIHTLKWMLSTLIAVHYEELHMPSNNEIHEKLLELKKIVSTERKKFPHQQLQTFPDDPKDLPNEIYDYAYTSSDPPTPFEVQGVHAIAAKVSLRSNNHLLCEPKGKHSAAKASPKVSSAMATDRNHVKSEVKTEADANEPDRLTSGISCMSFEDRPRNGDLVEERLYTSYKADIWSHRAQKSGQLSGSSSQGAPQAIQPQAKQVALRPRMAAMKMERDCAEDRAFWDAAFSNDPEDEIPVPAKKLKREAVPSCPAEPCTLDDPDSDDLDEHTKAAIMAMRSRGATKKEEAKAAKEEAAASAKKRPAAAVVKSAPGVKEESVKPTKANAKQAASSASAAKVEVKDEKPMKANVKGAIEEIPKAHILKAMPATRHDGSNPPPVHYAGGVIYTSSNNRKFKCLTIRADKWSEKQVAWGTTRTKQEAWKIAVAAIDAKRKEESKKKK